MYIDSIELENVRTFATKRKIDFIHPDKFPMDKPASNPKPAFPNVNLIFGDNAAGKTTVLESIALSALGPTAESSRVSPRRLVRFVPNKRRPTDREKSKQALIHARLVLHGSEQLRQKEQTGLAIGSSELLVRERGEIESFQFVAETIDTPKADWEQAYESDNELFFAVAYGATRRVEQKSYLSTRRKTRSEFGRAMRLESVMQEGYPLFPMQSWFTRRKKNKRWIQIVEIINELMGGEHFSFDGKYKDGEFFFSKGGIDVPFRSLSDGYRSFLGWVTDLLYHLDSACKISTMDLKALAGVVLVDEIDLHLHPKWQMSVVERLSRTFPRLQFIFTSHSPLIAGSVEWMNVVHLQLDSQHRTSIDQFEESIHGLDADQILVSSLFGLESTRASTKRDELHNLTVKARKGDKIAAKKLISAMAMGLEKRK